MSDRTDADRTHDAMRDGQRDDETHDATRDRQRDDETHDATRDGQRDDETHDATRDGQRDDETHDEQLEREHEQLFHELRAIIPGAEVLFAFMLTVAFTERFKDITDVQRWVYYVTLLSAGTSLLLLLAPASFHRIQFRRHDKEAMMRIANVEAISALVLISVAVAGSVFLITDLMFSTGAAIAVAAVMWTCAGALWWLVPLARRTTEPADGPAAGPARAG